MSNPASFADIEARWRTLSAPESFVAQTRLDDAWRKLKREIPDLETRMVDDGDLSADVVRVLADAVVRVLQSNARDGLRKGAVGIDDGSASWELDATVQTSLYFTEAEYADLSGSVRSKRARAFSVQPT